MALYSNYNILIIRNILGGVTKGLSYTKRLNNIRYIKEEDIFAANIKH